jgi:hypothetical protein
MPISGATQEILATTQENLVIPSPALPSDFPLRENRLFPAGKAHIGCQSEFTADVR